MKLSAVILIILSLFLATDVYALSDEAVSIIQKFKNKYNREQNTNSALITKSDAAKVEESTEPTLTVTEIKEEKKYIPGLAFSKALSRYRAARKTGVFQKDAALDVPVTTSETRAKKLKRYNINFIQVSDKKNSEEKYEEKIESNFSDSKESSEQQLRTDESSASLLKKADTALNKTKEIHVDSTITKKKDREPIAPDLPRASTTNSSKKSEEEEAIDAVATPEDDEEFNQFIRRYDFKMPDNYRIIVR
jgi:hypothetical protein